MLHFSDLPVLRGDGPFKGFKALLDTRTSSRAPPLDAIKTRAIRGITVICDDIDVVISRAV